MLLTVPLDRIRRNPEQPRERFDDDALDELAASIRTHGLLCPLLVRREGEHFVLVAGERRWRAAGRAGKLELPVLVTEKADSGLDALLLALVENLQRADLDPVEEARGYQRLVEGYGLSHEELARSVGRSRSTITNSLRLLRLPPRALRALSAGQIATGHGKALLALRNPIRISALLHDIVHQGLSVRATERRVRALNRTELQEPRREARGRYQGAADLLSRQLGAPVQIDGSRDGQGRIVIRYSSEEELTWLVDRLGGERR